VSFVGIAKQSILQFFISEGGSNGINFAFPFVQHNPLVSFLYFNALQYWQTEFIGPIAT
jgi:hypothetical protein